MLSKAGGIFTAGSDKIRVGLIGCGGRGSAAAMDWVMNASVAGKV
jgi:hypothetical protein